LTTLDRRGILRNSVPRAVKTPLPRTVGYDRKGVL